MKKSERPCLHDWVPASPLLYGSYAFLYCVCRKCGKIELTVNT